jgi:hypothetical protein
MLQSTVSQTVASLKYLPRYAVAASSWQSLISAPYAQATPFAGEQRRKYDASDLSGTPTRLKAPFPILGCIRYVNDHIMTCLELRTHFEVLRHPSKLAYMHRERATHTRTRNSSVQVRA